jgi:hypothetical protein
MVIAGHFYHLCPPFRATYTDGKLTVSRLATCGTGCARPLEKLGFADAADGNWHGADNSNPKAGRE